MKKLNFIVPCVCLLVLLFSCKKDTTDPTPQEMNKDVSFTKTSFATAVNQDTVPPSNAVSVKTYGAVGNGSADDTKAIQNAINAQTNVYFPKGTYIISSNLNMRSGVRVYGTNGATIKAANNMNTSAGNRLYHQGMYFYLNGVSKCWISNLIFQPASSQAFGLGAWSNSCIYLGNSFQNDVKWNTFKFTQAYSKTGMEGIWISGAASKNNYVGNNKLTTVGLEYAESGASNNTVISNTITNSHSDAMSAHGNTTTFCTSNQVINNTIINAGHMGIEDFGNVNGTLISGNTITGTGKSAAEAGSGFGISIVGVNSTATLNSITDAQVEYIEVGGNCKIVTHNVINDTKGLADGVVVNLTAAANAAATIKTTTIDHNTFYGTMHSVVVVGNYNPNVSITNNFITNPFCMGIDVTSNATSYAVNIASNSINLTKPNNQSRIGIATYASSLYSGQKSTINSNTITYSTAAGGGPGTEYAFLPRTNNVTISGNKVTANNIKNAKGSLVIVMSASTERFTGYTITNNTFLGAYEDLSGYISAILSGNIL